ncbi:TonB-dependent receptor [Gilvimarinus agarilyticus]|uniref:TonB-dependent receptor n=1 Tax=unclassified Gilvimarinus TaxID=2642066 RepID=UPI001C0A2F46|nr:MULTISPECIES: TonB-dependent receptor [unclassified Gilvimarinus]MBU2887858.1 TonB-dependent receptor [Gilvimarinus agarilyticus]MDO6572496.1 TonB-dependent receptor [Gilvimarinus sp. 2_MG-2023]MDO6746636.1 TonB-dependent receptor [Gilvimarinus sp. 1_MG-2023]
MNFKQTFKRKLIATAIASTAVAGFGNASYAQEEESLLEEVIVTGIRASLQRSMDLKRDANGVVDAISAEDIGKFPDTNLAESLQRISGVSINRRDGEGSKVTVRGLGPDFNTVLLNGRQMPGATLESTVASGSRSFDFANIASEGVSAVEVYKTTRADAPPGGMGATINIVTPKPLESDAVASFGVKGVYDESSQDSSLTPEISGIYSNTFADGKIGVAVTGSYQERKGGSAAAQVGTGWRSFQGSVVQDWGGQETVDWEWGGIDFNGNHQNQPSADDIYSTPQQMGYVFTEFERERTNGQLTLQFAPTDALTATLDYTYSENTIASTYNDVGGWFNFGGQSTIFTDYDSPAVQTPILYSEDMTAGDLPMGVGRQAAKYENNSVGLNLEWQVSDKLKLSLDAHSSSAEASPDNEYGNSVGVAVSAYVRDRTTINVAGDMPVLILDVLDGAGGSDLRVQDMQVSGSYFRNSRMKQDIDQIQFDGEYAFTDELKLQFGVARTESDYRSSFSNVQREAWGGLGEPGMLDEQWFTPETILDRFDGSYGETTQEQIAFLGGSNAIPLDQYYSFSFEDVRNFAAANLDDGEGPADCPDGSTWYCAQAPDQFNDISESSDSAYVSVAWQTNIAAMPFNLLAGVRYESTEVETPASAQAYGPVSWVSANEFTMRPVGDAVAVTDSGEYDFVLPSIDASLEVVDDVVLRASYGQSIARPDWLDLRGGTSYSEGLRINGATADRGSPGLEPYKADNFDISAEWYFADASYVSVGYFEKEVENFIGTQVVFEDGPLNNTPHPAMGERFQAAVDSGLSPNAVVDIRQYIYDNYADPDTAYIDGSGNIVIVGIPGEDPNTPVEVTEVANSDQVVNVDGLEFAVQHTFGESGFGFMANYTLVDVDTNFDDMLLRDPQFSLPGVSDTANLVAFYEKHGFQARIAYNWRDAFLASGASGTGNNPIYVDEYSQVDINVSYDVTENLSVFVEGINVTEESGRNYGRSYEQVLGYYQGYARYNLGARYTF